MNYQDTSHLILGKILTDLKLNRSRLEEGDSERRILIHDHYLELDSKRLTYEIDLKFYQKVSELLIEVYPHYMDVMGDIVYNAFNERTSNESAIDTIGTHCTVIKQWRTENGKATIESYQLMADAFRGIAFSTGGQWLAAVRFNKKPWEYFASRQHTGEIALMPYFCDLFIRGKVEQVKPRESVKTILERALPDWHPLISSDKGM